MSNQEEAVSQRLDHRVIQQHSDLSRSFVTKIISEQKVRVNGKVVTKAGYKVKPEDTLEIDYKAEEQVKIPEIELPILYEDDDCVVISKPVGLLTHSKGAFNPEATVATWLSSRVKGMGSERAGIVHRLDRATSGVMICAKTPEALSWLQKQFAQRRTKKTYNALIEGTLQPEEAIIDMPIERNPKKPQTFRVGSNGKPSKTLYKVIEVGKKYSLIELKPETGRTHQLRVHLKQLNHPIIGDTLYEGVPADRLYLHALSLELTLPNRERRVFTTELSKEFLHKVK